MLKDKVILIIGVNGVIGRNLKKALEEDGARVFGFDINNSDFIGSITSESDLKSTIESLENQKVKIDTVINAAYPKGKNYGAALEQVSYESFNENLNLHLGGYFLVMRVFGKYFSKNGSGNIINFSSIYGSIAPKFEIYKNTNMTMPVEYAAIKSGILHLTRYFASFYKKEGVRFNCISPGGIEDGQSSSFLEAYKNQSGLKGMLSPHDLNDLVIFLSSDGSKYINGQNFIMDDGFSL